VFNISFCFSSKKRSYDFLLTKQGKCQQESCFAGQDFPFSKILVFTIPVFLMKNKNLYMCQFLEGE